MKRPSEKGPQPPSILTPEQAAALLAESKDNDLLALHAIGLFRGLRVIEIKKLDWRDVDLAGGFIHASAVNSKTRSRRLVPILENLRAWLQPMAKPAGPIVERALRSRHEAARNQDSLWQRRREGERPRRRHKRGRVPSAYVARSCLNRPELEKGSRSESVSRPLVQFVLCAG